MSKVDLFRQLSPRWIADVTLSSELRVLMAAEAERLRVKRNRVAHGTWGNKAGDRNMLYLMNASPDKRILPKAERITPQDVKTWAKELDALNRKLIAFHKKLGAPAP